MISRPHHGRLPRLSPSVESSGMTLLEVLIAITLFTVFTAVTVMVSELMAAMLSSDQKSTVVSECGSPPIDRACVELYFDNLVSTLEDPTTAKSKIWTHMRQCKQNPAVLFDLDFAQIPKAPWPSDYDVCIYDYGSQNSSFIEDLSAGRPGLYLLQARPVVASPLKRPVQRLFCRPSILCR